MFYTQSYKKISLYKIVPLYKIEIIWLLYFFTIICQYQYGTELFFFSKEKNEDQTCLNLDVLKRVAA